MTHHYLISPAGHSKIYTEVHSKYSRKSVDNYISAFSKGVFRCCRQLVIVYMFVVQYLSVKCAVFMHLSFTCIKRMIDFGVCVFVYLFSTLNVMGRGSYLMGHGSHIRWVNGSWVNSNDPLPALLPTQHKTELICPCNERVLSTCNICVITQVRAN